MARRFDNITQDRIDRWLDEYSSCKTLENVLKEDRSGDIELIEKVLSTTVKSAERRR